MGKPKDSWNMLDEIGRNITTDLRNLEGEGNFIPKYWVENVLIRTKMQMLKLKTQMMEEDSHL